MAGSLDAEVHGGLGAIDLKVSMEGEVGAVFGDGVAPEGLEGVFCIEVEDEDAAGAKMSGHAGEGAGEVFGVEQVVEAGVEASSGVDGFVGVEGAHVGLQKGDGAAGGANSGLVEHGFRQVDADDAGAAVGLEDGVGSGAAGEVNEAAWAAELDGEPLVDAGGDEDGVLEAVEALPSVVNLGEGAIRRWIFRQC